MIVRRLHGDTEGNITNHFLKIVLILSSHLRLGLPSALFPSGFPTEVLYAFLISHACYVTRPY